MRKAAFVLVLLLTPNPALAGGLWPVIVEQKHTYYFDSSDQSDVKQVIYSANGEPLYDFECHSGDYTGNDPNFVYSGFFDCKLEPRSTKDWIATLFTSPGRSKKYWDNRGRFLDDHLRGACATYPNWGAERHFRVRGMHIILRIRDFWMSSSRDAAKFKFDAEFRNDPTATTRLSEKPKEPEPHWFSYPGKCYGLVEGKPANNSHP